MTEHTNGLLATFEVGDNGNLAIGSEDKTSLLTIVDEDGIDFAALYHAADARRIVACWNLLDGYTTEEMEGVTLAEFVASHPELAEKALIAAYASIFADCGATNYLEVKGARPELGSFTITLQRTEGLTPAQELEAMTKQRDVLREALELSLAAMEHMGNALNEMDAVTEEDEVYYAAFEKARAALEFAEGEQS